MTDTNITFDNNTGNNNTGDNNFDKQYKNLNPSTDEKKFKLGGIINVNTGATKEMFYELDLNDDEKKETGKYYSISGVKSLPKHPNMVTRVKNFLSLSNKKDGDNNNQNKGVQNVNVTNNNQNGGKSKKNKKNGKKSNKKLRKTIKIRV